MFTWIAIYTELAKKLVSYRDRPDQLVQLLRAALEEQNLPTDWLRDKDAEGKPFPLEKIDPFTFFAAFNRGITDDNRRGLLGKVQSHLSLPVAIPKDFDGIPVFDNRNSWFFNYQPKRAADDIDNLWQLYCECVNKPPGDLPAGLFEHCVKFVGAGKMTIGLFLANPSQYVALDGVMRRHLSPKLGGKLDSKASTLSGYVALIEEIRKAFPGKQFAEISHEAWMARKKHDWIMALGQKSEFWDDCYARGIVRVGWDDLDEDLIGLSYKELEKKYEKTYGNKDDLKGIAEFLLEMQPGDRVFIKRGRGELIAVGEITGEYGFDATQDRYRHFRPAKWLSTGSWPLPESIKQLPIKTLTPITNPKRLQELLTLVGTIQEAHTDAGSSPKLLPSLNIILYGPPGTGKTWSLLKKYAELFVDQSEPLTEDERAEQVTADLSWWEVVTMVMLDVKQGRVPKLLEHPLLKAKAQASQNKHPNAAVWAHLQAHTDPNSPNVDYARRREPFLFEKSADSVWSIRMDAVEKEVPELIARLKAFKTPGSEQKTEPRYEFVTFHQSYSYEDFVEGIRPVLDDEAELVQAAEGSDVRYRIEPGIFKRIAERAKRNPSKAFALFIDEINRGNIASILGELITLIEDDKRKGAKHELSAKLPYSKKEFFVPSNLYIIGTMNTADRSVEALDTALRRRFTFMEISPDVNLVDNVATLPVDLKKLMTTINSRIEKLVDRDHCIGHSFFMDISKSANPLQKLRQAFKHKLLPLLREYFYGNPGKIGMILGERFVRRKEEDAVPFASGSWGVDELDVKEVFEVIDPETLSAEDFASVYAAHSPSI